MYKATTKHFSALYDYATGSYKPERGFVAESYTSDMYDIAEKGHSGLYDFATGLYKPERCFVAKPYKCVPCAVVYETGAKTDLGLYNLGRKSYKPGSPPDRVSYKPQ